MALALVLLICVWIAASLSPTPNDPCAQYADHHQAYKECAETASTQAVAKYTEWLADFTAVLAFFTVVLAGASIWQGSLTKQSIDLARDDFTATHRPWVSVRVGIGGRGLYFDQNGANLDIMTFCENRGSTPAVNLAVCIKPFFWPKREGRSNTFVLDEQRGFCGSLRTRQTHPSWEGRTLFPGDDPLHERTVYSFCSKEELEGIVKERGALPPLTIVGCVDYMFSFGERAHHQTGFAYELQRRKAGEVGVFVIEYPVNVHHDLLTLDPWHEGAAFYAD